MFRKKKKLKEITEDFYDRLIWYLEGYNDELSDHHLNRKDIEDCFKSAMEKAVEKVKKKQKIYEFRVK